MFGLTKEHMDERNGEMHVMLLQHINQQGLMFYVLPRSKLVGMGYLQNYDNVEMTFIKK